MSEIILDSIENLNEEFDKVEKVLTNEDINDDRLNDPTLFKKLLDIERFIKNQAIFSPNEEFEDIDLPLIKFLRLPHLFALAYSKRQGPDRINSLKESERFHLIFLHLLQHYSILPSSIGTVLKKYQEKGAEYKIDRDAKISLYKEEKSAEQELARAINKEAWREAARYGLICCAFQDINSLLFIPQEIEILNFKRNLETDAEAKQIYEEQRAQRPEKLNYFKIDSSKPDAPIISSEQIQGLGSGPDKNSVVVDYSQTNINKALNQREEILGKLNQHCYAQPKMTLDEFDELEYTLMKNKEKANAEGARLRKEELAKLGIEDSEDSENEIVADVKRLKERNWDDWKDANEKGAGNRGNR